MNDSDARSPAEKRIVLNNLPWVWGDIVLHAGVSLFPGIVLLVLGVLAIEDAVHRTIYIWCLVGGAVLWPLFALAAWQGAGRIVCKIEIEDGRIFFHFPFTSSERPWSELQDLQFRHGTTHVMIPSAHISITRPVAIFQMNSGETYSLFVTRAAAEQLWRLKTNEESAAESPCPFRANELLIPLPTSSTDDIANENSTNTISIERSVRQDLNFLGAINIGLTVLTVFVVCLALFGDPAAQQAKPRDEFAMTAMAFMTPICWIVLLVVSFRCIRALVWQLTFGPNQVVVHYLWRQEVYSWNDVQDLRVKMVEESVMGQSTSYPVIHVKLKDDQEVTLKTNQSQVEQLALWRANAYGTDAGSEA